MGDEEKYPASQIFKDFIKFHWKGLFTFIFPFILSPILIINFDKEWRTLYLVFLLAGYWITQSIPFWVAGLIPVVYVPCMGLLDSETVSMQYLREPIMHVFLGYLVILSIEYSKLNKRCALKLLALIGSRPRILHLVIMLFTMLISTVISNTITASLMCPIVGALLEELQTKAVFETEMEEDVEPLNNNGEKHPTRIAMAYYIGVAYAANIGGCLTSLGTATNYLLAESYKKLGFGKLEAGKFTLWNILPMFIIFVFILIFIQITCMGLFRKKSTDYIELAASSEKAASLKDAHLQSYDDLGPISTHEILVVTMLALTFCLLIFRRPEFFKGYADALDEKLILASTPLALSALILFMLPINCDWCKHCFGKAPFPEGEIPSTMSWGFLHRNFPWGLLFLLGANFVIMEAILACGLERVLTENIKILENTSNALAQFTMIFLTMVCTNIFTNPTVAGVAVPICTALAKLRKTHPIYFIMPVGVASSHAFHLKCSTPPNLIVTRYGKIKTKYLGLAGIGPSISSLLILFLMGQTWQKVIFPNSNMPPET